MGFDKSTYTFANRPKTWTYFFYFGATQEYLAFLKIRLGLIIVLLNAFLTPAQAEQKH